MSVIASSNEPKSTSTPNRIVESILDDLQRRKGLGDEWDSYPEDIKDEIREAWTEIVAKGQGLA